jgi:RNA polymerase sigma-70 factor, ECF subfamily
MYSDSKRYEEKALDLTIEQFLASVEKKAFRMAEIATKNQTDSLDIVQDTMIKLVEKYAHKPAEQWKPLFYRILHSRIMDYFRRKKIQQSLFFWKRESNEETDYSDDLIDSASDHITPEREITGAQTIEKVTQALKQLPPRQQQCFLLRSWEGLSVIETAHAMSCSEGSVKTHYSRAKQSLKQAINHE